MVTPSINRYAWSIAGSASTSIAHFVASVLLFRSLPPSEFGILAMVLVVVYFACGLSNALAGTPFTLAVVRLDYKSKDSNIFLKVNAIVAMTAAVACGAVAWTVNGWGVSLLLAAFAGLFTLRSFSRTCLFAMQGSKRASISDLLYSVALLFGLGVVWYFGQITSFYAAACYFFAAAVGAITAGRFGIKAHLRGLSRGCISEFVPIWKTQARWALLGVVSTEATSNGHAYLVSALAGPTAFAPLAAAALLFRPVGLCLVALTQIDRPNIARSIASGAMQDALGVVKRFRVLCVVAWCLTTLVVLAVMIPRPDYVLRPEYELKTMVIAVALFAGMAGVNAWRAGESVLLQAAGWLAPLAMTTIWGGVVSIVAALAFLLISGPAASLIGMIVGQIVMAWLIRMLVLRWKRESK